MAKKLKPEDKDAAILRESRKRFNRCVDWEKSARALFESDIEFAEGDSDNLFQWPEAVRTRMQDNDRALLTINKTKQHCLDIINDARQSRVAIKIRATGGGASAESAQVFAGVVRHIEYISNAAAAYQHALGFAVRGGIGYWRVVTDYANDDSFDQEVFIRPINDPLSVYLDPDIVQFDGSDAGFGFVFTDSPKDEYEARHPDHKEATGPSSIFNAAETWAREDQVRMAEYFRRVEVSDKLLAYDDPDKPAQQGQQPSQKVVRASDLEPELVKQLLALPSTKSRPIRSHKVEWFKIVGDTIVERGDWPGIYIPIVRCVGEETVIKKTLDRKGQTRALKDPQRMFNYNAVGSVEFGALQSKTPYVGPADAIEGFTQDWENANKQNLAFLAYNHRDDEGNEIPAPRRQEPPTGAPVFIQGMNDAAEWMRMVSGQYQADMGAPSNERSGAAINARQRQGDNATFHFLDHQGIAIRYTGKILLDLIPKIYDTERVLEIMSENGVPSKVKIDPSPDNKEAFQKVAEDRDEVVAIFNPKVGKYEVESDVGPAFATQRQEAWNAYVQILTQNKDLVHLIGDLAFKCADFPGADEIAERLKRMVPQQALQDGPSPDLAAAQQQIQQMQALMQQLAQKLADKTAENSSASEKNAVSAYEAQTRRLAALKEALLADPEGLIGLVKQVIAEAEATSGPGLAPALDQGPPAPMAPQPPPPQPMGPAGGPGGDLDNPGPNLSPQDMGAGPAAGAAAGPMPA